MKVPLLYRSSWRYFLQHPLQFLFSVLGVALGVALIVGIDIASHSARQGFYLSSQSILGQASHRIIHANNTVPESIYTQLRNHLGLQTITPLIKQTLSVYINKNRSLDMQLIGIDPFSEVEIRSWQKDAMETLSGDGLQRLLTEPDTILVSGQFLKHHHLQVGDQLFLEFSALKTAVQKTSVKNPSVQNKTTLPVTIIGSFNTPEHYQSQLKNWMISDISTAQELLNTPGYISQIDLRLDERNELLISQIKALLPEGIQLVNAKEYSNAIAHLSQSFELNLSALSLLGLLVAMFLIYNTMMFSVVQRRDLMARLRVLGITRSELFRIVLLEAFLIASMASLIGILLGMGLAHFLLYFVTQTINDLYYVLQVKQLHWDQVSLLKALTLGIGATLLATLIPAFEAAYTKPMMVLQRSNLEGKMLQLSLWLIVPGITGCLLVIFLVKEQVGGIVVGFSLVFLFIISLVCLLPMGTRYLLMLLSMLMKRFFSLPGKIAVNNISRSFSRSIVAIIALTVSVSSALGIGIMVGSFRFTVDEWLMGYLKADYFISPQDKRASTAKKVYEPALFTQLSELPGVEYISSVQDVSIYYKKKNHLLNVLDIPIKSFDAFRLKQGDSQTAQKAWFEDDAVIISEPYAYRHGLSVGDELFLPVSLLESEKLKAFKIVGVFYHYGSEQGVINMSRKTYDRYWHEKKLTNLGVYLSDNVLQDDKKLKLFETQLHELMSHNSLSFISKQDLRKESLVIFDRTFKITNILKILVILVSFVGILSALMAIELERSREFAILRAIGLTGKQLSLLVNLETLSMGIVAAVFAMPIGIALAYLLIEVVNYRSFGWSMQLILPWNEFFIAALLAISAAILAGIYPAWHLSKTQPALMLRSE